MKRYLLALLLLGLPLLLISGAGAQTSLPNVTGRWGGGDFSNGLELQLDHESESPEVVRGLVSMTLRGTDGPVTAWVYGRIEADGTLQLQTTGRTRGTFPRYVLNLQMNVPAGEASVAVCPVGGKNLPAPILRKVRDVQPTSVPVGQAYLLGFQDRQGRPTGVTCALDVPNRASGKFRLSPGASVLDGATEGPCTIFVPLFDPGFLIFTLRDPRDNTAFASMRVRASDAAATSEPYLNVPGADFSLRRTGQASVVSDRGTAVLITP